MAAVHDRSDGIPLHIEELLAAVGAGAPTPQSGPAVRAAAVPDTLADAVLSRARHLAARTRAVASAAAVIGRSFDFDLLTAVTGADPAEVAAALRELQEAYLVLPGADAVTFDFRHALIRDTLYADTDLPARRRLHESAARTAAQRGYRGAFVSAHFEQAQRAEHAYRHAIIAAREAAAMSAHGQALELYRRAVRNLPRPRAAGAGRTVRRARRRGRGRRRQHRRRRGVPDRPRGGRRRRSRAHGGRAGAAHGRGRPPAR
nr:hypothetical protein GCM10020093_011150 [Planobispora longispora]